MKWHRQETINLITALSILLIICSTCFSAPTVAADEFTGMVLIPDGFYVPLYKDKDGPKKIPVESFYLDPYLVSNEAFIKFVNTHPKWLKENNKPIFSDVNYLKHISAATLSDKAQQPVINISWFAARAYCKAINKRLPTTAEWEYVAAASKTQANGKNDAAYKQQILDWYAKPASAELPNVQQTPVNYWGVYGLHGVVWEIVNDFNRSELAKISDLGTISPVIGLDFYHYKKDNWVHAWASVMPLHKQVQGDERYSFGPYATQGQGTQWTDISLGAVTGWKITKRFGIFAEMNYVRYWDREVLAAKAGLNYQFR